MEKYPDSKRPDEYILKLLEINLTKNDFEFDSKFYLQDKGTAMDKNSTCKIKVPPWTKNLHPLMQTFSWQIGKSQHESLHKKAFCIL